LFEIAHLVKCFYCGLSFDRDKHPFKQVSGKRYAHEACAKLAEDTAQKEEKDKQLLEEFICKLFKEDFVNPRIRKQINQYMREYHYSYSGIYKTLQYWYEIKNNDISKANGGIGIVPYVYDQAKQYFISIWIAHQQNEDKIVADYVPEVREIRIRRPNRQVKRKRRFAFLDKEEGDN
jgi:hypothetical protein